MTKTQSFITSLCVGIVPVGLAVLVSLLFTGNFVEFFVGLVASLIVGTFVTVGSKK